MKITAVRHGETEGNLLRVVESHSGGKLTEDGRLTMRDVAEQLSHRRFSRAYCSDLARGRESADIILNHLSIGSLLVTPKLPERDQGVYEGKAWTELPWYDNESKHLATEIPGGESWLKVRQRVGEFVNEVYLGYEHPELESVLFITHGGVIKVLKSLVHRTPLSEAVDMVVPNGHIWEGEVNRPLIYEAV